MPLRTPERRSGVRHQLDRAARLRVYPPESHPARWARVQNLSTSGLALRLCGELQPGSRLSIEFTGSGSPGRAVEAKVVHCTTQGDGTWLVGCCLAVPLKEEEIKNLLLFREITSNQPAQRAEVGDLECDKPQPAILVVEAEPAIRKLLVYFLALQGRPILEAASGTEAVALLQTQDGPVGLSVIDLQMPGLDGVETLRTVKQLRPDLPCCLMSGEMIDDKMLLEVGACGFLKKPFTLAHLADCLTHYQAGRRVTLTE